MGDGVKPPTRDATCAVVVTYHPDGAFPTRLRSISDLTAHVVIVDNGSSPEALSMLRAIADLPRISLIENSENLGIATALNQGVRLSIERGYAWSLLFDQDSLVDSDMLEGLLRAVRSISDAEEAGLIGTNYWDENRQQAYLHPRKNYHSFAVEQSGVITSGSLLSNRAFERVGPFRDDFFIDFVDHEYCMRLRRHGYKVLVATAILMTHRLGNPVMHGFFRKKLCAHHSPLRRYYITRNRLVLARDYFRDEPRWVLRDMRSMVHQVLHILLWEDLKLRKLKAVSLGIWHALMGKMGRAPPV